MATPHLPFYANLLIFLQLFHFLVANRARSAHYGRQRDEPPRKEVFPMLRGFSDRLRNDAHHKVQRALRQNGIVNIIQLSEEIRLMNLGENIAREDIETLVMQVAQLYGGAIEFDEEALTALDLPDACPADSRNDLEKALRERSLLSPESADLLQVSDKG
ncbi:hypothetical protein [Mesorhizobium sp. WSM3866]|uniref:hypothetical protein n=1 Tax=Mesorhizobium sp. WSM3866 TaxID=422271 RepID=UPI001140D2FD|nr:hypothetical protein [Mesorhizobium sp. WSM3866]